MPNRTPTQISKFVDEHQYRMDLPSQFYGDEPNSYRKDWDSASVRWVVVASWPYEAAAGNQSIPAVYKAINIGRSDFLCDRFYLPATPRDLRLFESGGIPIFGIESKHQMRDFDVVATSIAYPILTMSFVKMLKMSDIPVRWRDREAHAEDYPMVVVGGQAYGAPEILAPIVDAVWCFSGNTRFVTKDGPRDLASTVGETVEVWSDGEWRKAEVRSFGKQELVEYEFAPASLLQAGTTVGTGRPPYQYPAQWRQQASTRYRVREQATADHRWELVDGTVTSELKVGDVVKVALPEPTDSVDELRGFVHGVFFGDGRRNWSASQVMSFNARLFGKKADLLPELQRSGLVRAVANPDYYAGDPFVTVHADCDLKDYPLPSASSSYVHGFIRGVASTDGNLSARSRAKQGVWSETLFSSREDFAPWLEANAAYGGWSVRSIKQDVCDRVTPQGVVYEQYPVWRVTVAQGDNIAWKVTAATPIGPEEVYCAVVPDTHRFTLASSLYTCNCGEVEDEPGNPGIAAFTARIAQFKDEGRWQTQRVECYKDLAREFNFLYFPRFIDVAYDYEDRTHVEVGPHPSKQVVAYTSNLPGMRLPVLKRIVKDMDAIEPLDNPPLLYSDPGMGSGDLEVGRGCPAWCSFCALTYRQKPYRQRSVPYMVDFASKFHTNMGGTHLMPFMPDFPMHTQRKKLIKELLLNVSDEVDAGAMRVDDFIADGDFILLQVHGGLDGVTLGVEGNSQRMRDLVGKGTSDADIREAVARGIRAGVRKFKMFMISNLPGEDEGDIFRILKLAKDLADIREGMGQPHVRIQFSWTPLLIEANTPFQWFAPPTSARALGDVWEEFRDLKIDFKLGGKNEMNKAAFFQLCQRASREVGEALVDAMDICNVACWGGVPKSSPTKLGMRDLLDQQLKLRGFQNGFDDCFDERFKHDMFGWEFIDQGVSTELLWVTYLQMREFVEETDSHTYDLNFDDSYHGNEWIERCDTKCYGKTCGTCDAEDLRKRRQYIVESQSDADIDLATIVPIDQRSQAVRVRARIYKPERYRFVQNDHWRYNFRRAFFRSENKVRLEVCPTPREFYGEQRACRVCEACRAVPGITKRTIRFASDDIKYKDWTCGFDYVEFGLTKLATRDQIQRYMDLVNTELMAQGTEETRWLEVRDWVFHPATAPSMRTDVDLSLWELEVDDEPGKVLAKLQAWEDSDYVKMTLHQDAAYFNMGSEEVNAKDFVEDVWLRSDGHRVALRLTLRGRPSPYNIYAALMGRASWLDAASKAAIRLDSFVEVDRDQADFFRPSCSTCGRQIHTNIMDEPFDMELCPRCKDEDGGFLIRELTYA